MVFWASFSLETTRLWRNVPLVPRHQILVTIIRNHQNAAQGGSDVNNDSDNNGTHPSVTDDLVNSNHDSGNDGNTTDSSDHSALVEDENGETITNGLDNHDGQDCLSASSFNSRATARDIHIMADILDVLTGDEANEIEVSVLDELLHSVVETYCLMAQKALARGSQPEPDRAQKCRPDQPLT